MPVQIGTKGSASWFRASVKQHSGDSGAREKNQRYGSTDPLPHLEEKLPPNPTRTVDQHVIKEAEIGLITQKVNNPNQQHI